MKFLPLFIIGGIVAEFIMFGIATIFNMSGWDFIITIGILPVGLIVGSIVYLGIKMFQPEPTAPEKDENADKKTD